MRGKGIGLGVDRSHEISPPKRRAILRDSLD